MKNALIAFVTGVVLYSVAFAQNAGDFQRLEQERLTVQTDGGEVSLTVELANDPEEIRIGLMNRSDLADNEGMLFDFGVPREANMWMKNTVIPLDMLFMDAEGTILAIARDTEPQSTRIINPGFRVKGVLELNAGASERLGIEPGDTMVHPIFGNAPEPEMTAVEAEEGEE